VEGRSLHLPAAGSALLCCHAALVIPPPKMITACNPCANRIAATTALTLTAASHTTQPLQHCCCPASVHHTIHAQRIGAAASLALVCCYAATRSATATLLFIQQAPIVQPVAKRPTFELPDEAALRACCTALAQLSYATGLSCYCKRPTFTSHRAQLLLQTRCLSCKCLACKRLSCIHSSCNHLQTPHL
jgi:hypothetical protein